MREGRLLTAPGGEVRIDDTLRDVAALFDDGRLLVSKSVFHTPAIRSFASRSERQLGRKVVPESVELSVIQSIYREHGAVPGRTPTSVSAMQLDAEELFKRAIAEGASDIHIDVTKRNDTRIRMRVDGDLGVAETHTHDYGVMLCSTIYQAMSDVSDSTFDVLSRQDARIGARNKLPAGLDGIRIATTPQVGGFEMVLRLLYTDSGNECDVASLGYDKSQDKSLLLMRKRPTGINIIAGPTGSGKSTTLQRVMYLIDHEYGGRKQIITVEDPPEYPIRCAVQTPVANAETEEERSRAFQSAIKATMRLDPDVIMVGEMRDGPSALLAIQAAMTGHRVWTTLHATGALAILDRLIGMGIPRDLVFDANIITGLICQRLVKRLCPHCKQPMSAMIDRLDTNELHRILRVVSNPQDVYVHHPDGCIKCKHKGTIGRIAVAEVVVTDNTLMHYLRKGDRREAIDYWQRNQDGKTLIEAAIAKVAEGLVDPFLAEDEVGPLTMAAALRDHRLETSEIANVV